MTVLLERPRCSCCVATRPNTLLLSSSCSHPMNSVCRKARRRARASRRPQRVTTQPRRRTWSTSCGCCATLRSAARSWRQACAPRRTASRASALRPSTAPRARPVLPVLPKPSQGLLPTGRPHRRPCLPSRQSQQMGSSCRAERTSPCWHRGGCASAQAIRALPKAGASNL